MKKILSSILIISVLIFFAIEILIGSDTVLEAVQFSLNIWQTNIFPSLFPFFVLSELLIHYGFVELVSELFKNVMQKLFRINGYASFVFIMSIISGFPSSAKYTRELYLSGKLNKDEAAKLLTFTHFSNPLFILGTVSILFLKNKEVGLLILFCHYIVNIIIGLLFRNYAPSKCAYDKISFKEAILMMHKKRIANASSFGSVISNAVLNSIQTLLLILGTVTIFLVITTIIDNNLSLSQYYQAIINGTVEMTQGLKYVSLLEIPLKLKSILTVMILSFGGFSVHMQILSILSDTEIKYLPFLSARLLHAALSGVLIYILFDIWLILL